MQIFTIIKEKVCVVRRALTWCPQASQVYKYWVFINLYVCKVGREMQVTNEVRLLGIWLYRLSHIWIRESLTVHAYYKFMNCGQHISSWGIVLQVLLPYGDRKVKQHNEQCTVWNTWTSSVRSHKQIWPSWQPVIIVFWSLVTRIDDMQWVGAVLPHRTTGTTSPLDVMLRIHWVSSWHKYIPTKWNIIIVKMHM